MIALVSAPSFFRASDEDDGLTRTIFKAVGDAFVDEARPEENFGGDETLLVGSVPNTQISYLRFDVQGLVGSIVRAKLRVYTGANPSSGYHVHPVTGGAWEELDITFPTAPSLGEAVDSSVRVDDGWTRFFVTPLVTGVGEVSVAVTAAETIGTTSFASREAGGPTSPRLFVVTDASDGSDTIDPTIPQGLAATALSAGEVELSWTASTDNVEVTGYTIYRDGTELTTVDGETTSFSDTSVEPLTTYRYTVDASDGAGNRSEQSLPAFATTLSGELDTVDPSIPQGLAATALSAGEVELSWSASTDNVGVTGYTIYRDGAELTTVDGETTSYSDTSVEPLTTYEYTVDASDAAGNRSERSLPAFATTPAAADEPLIAAAGDLCGDCEPTARVVESIEPIYVLTMGDNQYPDGTLSTFMSDYDRSWGRFRSKTYPAPGNHDWNTANAQGYRDYFGARANPDGDGNTWYSFNVGNWHFVSLDSNCGDVGGCGVGSDQHTWLESDLAADNHPCTLAYWHHPRFSSGTVHGGTTSVQPFWELLHDDRADIVLSGHDHIYERFSPQDPSGRADANGVTEFVVGTGGAGLYPIGTPEPNSLVRRATTFGVLELTLHQGSYDFRFLSAPGETTLDSGSASCR